MDVSDDMKTAELRQPTNSFSITLIGHRPAGEYRFPPWNSISLILSSSRTTSDALHYLCPPMTTRESTVVTEPSLTLFLSTVCRSCLSVLCAALNHISYSCYLFDYRGEISSKERAEEIKPRGYISVLGLRYPPAQSTVKNRTMTPNSIFVCQHNSFIKA